MAWILGRGVNLLQSKRLFVRSESSARSLAPAGALDLREGEQGQGVFASG